MSVEATRQNTGTSVKLGLSLRQTQKAKLLAPTPERSRNMSAIRSTGNQSTELKMARILRKLQLSGWRRHGNLRGRPDFVWRNRRVVLFVDGCFWHGCPNCYRSPVRNSSYWSAKVSGNRSRDRSVTRFLRSEGWVVLRVWECRVGSVSTERRLRRTLEQSSSRRSTPRK